MSDTPRTDRLLASTPITVDGMLTTMDVRLTALTGLARTLERELETALVSIEIAEKREAAASARAAELALVVDDCRHDIKGLQAECDEANAYAIQSREAMQEALNFIDVVAWGDDGEGPPPAGIQLAINALRAALAKRSDGEEVRSLPVGGAQLAQTDGDIGGMPLSVGRSRPDQTATILDVELTVSRPLRLEALIEMCEGQAIRYPKSQADSDYNRGVYAAAKIMEDMLPPGAVDHFQLTPPSAEMLDAERYRYLRSAAGQWTGDECGPMVCSGCGDNFEFLRGEEVDQEVDESMAEWKAMGSPMPTTLSSLPVQEKP